MPREYDIAKSDCLCRGCHKRLEPGCELVATVREAADGLHREDFCPDCWSARPQQDRSAAWGSWHTHVPQPTEKRKLLVDDQMLVDLFERLENADTPAKADFRFVLALILMRKKLLVYDRTIRGSEDSETWIMHLRGSEASVEVVNPHLDDDRIAQVSGQLSQIMQGPLE